MSDITRTYFWHYVVDSEGRPIENAEVILYLNDDPTVEATIFLSETTSSYTTCSQADIKTDNNGFVGFWLGNEFEDGGHAFTQTFQLEWYKAGTRPGLITDINPWPNIFAWVNTDSGADKDYRNKFVSDFLANKWYTHYNEIIPSASPHDLHPVQYDTCLDNRYNKVVSDKFLNDIYNNCLTAGSILIYNGNVAEVKELVTSWTSSGNTFYKDISHPSFNHKNVTVQVTKDDVKEQIIPKRITNLSSAITRVFMDFELDVTINVQGYSVSSSSSSSSESSSSSSESSSSSSQSSSSSESVEPGILTFIDHDHNGTQYYLDVWGDGNFLYIGCIDGLRSYSVDGSGILTFIDSDYQGFAPYLDVWGDGTYVYVVCGNNGIRSYSVNVSGGLTHIDVHDPGSDFYSGVWSDGTYIYAACSSIGLKTYSVDGSGNLTHIDTDFQGDFYEAVWGDGDFIYAACWTGGIRSYSVDVLGNLTFIDSDDQGGNYQDVWGDGTYIYVATTYDGLRTYSVDASGGLTYIDTDDLGNTYNSVWGDGDFIYVAIDPDGIRSYSVDGSGILTAVDWDDQGWSYRGVWGDGDFIYCACVDGLRSYSVS